MIIAAVISSCYVSFAMAATPTAAEYFESSLKSMQRTQLLDSAEDSSIKKYFRADGGVDTRKVVETCEYLTNSRFKNELWLKLPARKPALISFANDLCETVQLGVSTGNQHPEKFKPLIYTLEVLKQSFHHRAKIEAGVSPVDILKMGINHDLSPWRLKFLRKKNIGAIANPLDSAFWKRLGSLKERLNYFDLQATQKGIASLPRVVELDQIDGAGSSPKIHVLESFSQSRWMMKWGEETHTDTVASRIFAALGYNVDHPYYFKPGSIYLVFPAGNNDAQIHTAKRFVDTMYRYYKVNLSPFIAESGKVGDAQIAGEPQLSEYRGQNFITFKSVAMEPRPETELRLGGILPNERGMAARRELRGSLLVHLWLNSWDVKEDNTLLAVNSAKIYGAFSDLGTSLGVMVNKFPRDLKGGLVNHYKWEMLEFDERQIRFKDRINSYPAVFSRASFEDLKWAAQQIAELNSEAIEKILNYSGWPEPVKKLYAQKIMARRQQILLAFDVQDPFANFIPDRHLNISWNNRRLVSDGELVAEPDLSLFPSGLLSEKGRFRGFGW